jgi:hypothetical protein
MSVLCTQRLQVFITQWLTAFSNVGREVLTAVVMKGTIFWDIQVTQRTTRRNIAEDGILEHFQMFPGVFVFSDLAVRGDYIRAEIRDELLKREQAGAKESGTGRGRGRDACRSHGWVLRQAGLREADRRGVTSVANTNVVPYFISRLLASVLNTLTL